MRTVHETEALRPSDPVPKSMQSGGGGPAKSSKLKIIIKTPQSHAAGQEDQVDDGSAGDDAVDANFFTPMTGDLGFTPAELEMPLQRLQRLCRCQVRWAEQDSQALKQEIKLWQELYKKAWLEKEALLDQVFKSEADWHERRKAVLSGAADVQVTADAVMNGGADSAHGDEPAAESVAVANGDEDKDMDG